jgi:hypothetical protein
LRERIRRGGPTIDLPAVLGVRGAHDALRRGEKLRAS